MWDSRFNLPNSPQNNNPHIYCAWATKVINDYDKINLMDPSPDSPYRDYYLAVFAYIKACEKEPGLFNRWPDGSGGVTPHDELMGIAWFSPEAASRILTYLAAHDGDYNNTTEVPKIPESWNLYRMYWFIQFLKARAGIKLSLISQFQWSVSILWDIITTKKETALKDSGGRWRNYMMLDAFKDYVLSGLFARLWVWRMNGLGYAPADYLRVEPGENPVMAEYGPKSFSV